MRLPHGYLIVQGLATYNASRFGAISTAEEAEKLLSQLDGRLDALEYESLFFDDHDLKAHEAVARVAATHRIDLWTSTFRILGRIRSFGAIRPEFQAHVMEPDGRIVPAQFPHEAGTAPQPIFDVLNPEAVDWFLTEYRSKYFERMKGLLAGVFFNEDCIHYLAKWRNDRRCEYWRNITFSPRVLSLWREYCREHDVTHEGKLVAKFPVHDPAMVANGGGRTACYPGWDVPEVIQPGQRFVDLPRAQGVWRHWYDFTCDLFLRNWIGRFAAAANETNRGEPKWKGTMYFGLHQWSLPYEQIEDPGFTVPTAHRWGAWGRQRGVDLARMAQHPEVDVVICETYPPIAANLEGFVAEYARITRAAGKTYGVMLHRDDEWALKLDEEPRRWALIEKYRPTVIARYPHSHMLPGNKFYSAEGERLFAEGLARYRKLST
ncbi:MAG: hypothetical protein AB1696_25970 [Planctomycetota bacterium]